MPSVLEGDGKKLSDGGSRATSSKPTGWSIRASLGPPLSGPDHYTSPVGPGFLSISGPNHGNEKGNIMTKDKVLETFTEHLPCKLTEEDMLQRGAELSAAELNLAEQKEEAKAVRASLTAMEKKLQGVVSYLAVVLKDGEEDREVECQSIAKFDKEEVIIQRLDTGDVIRKRPLTDQDRQSPLPGLGG